MSNYRRARMPGGTYSLKREQIYFRYSNFSF